VSRDRMAAWNLGVYDMQVDRVDIETQYRSSHRPSGRLAPTTFSPSISLLSIVLLTALNDP
jgi:hypothetical protein